MVFKREVFLLSEWAILGFTVMFPVLIGLIAVIYASLVKKIDTVQSNSSSGLGLKVDRVEYKVTREWQQEAVKDFKLVVKELKNENNEAHRGILLELKRIQDG
jgi:hypothetical protein